MSEQPVLCNWNGEVLRPASRYWATRADEQYVVGERYLVDVQHERSIASHRQFFASLNEAFMNLPAEQAERFGNPEALRKYALIRAGFRDERSIVCASKAEALRVAAFIRPLDEYAVISVTGTAVVVLTARSQSMRAMGKAEFQRSRDEVLRVLSEMIGVSLDALQREGRAA